MSDIRLNDSESVHDTMKRLFITKVNNAIHDLVVETKECMSSKKEFEYNPNIVLGSVRSANANETIDATTYKYFTNVLQKIIDIRSSYREQPACVVEKMFNDLDNMIK